MEIVIGLMAAALLVWLFLKDNTRRGVRTVKAFVYMRALRNGKSTDQANQEAKAVGDTATKRLIHDTMLHLQNNYGGRAKRLMKEAEKFGWRD